MPKLSMRHSEPIYLAGLSSVLVALGGFLFFFHQPGGPQYWSMPRDDFYYYLKIAENLVHGRGSTFNGLVPTNGYHPLYFLVVTVICHFTSSIDHVLSAVWLLTIGMTVTSFYLAYRILRCFSDQFMLCASSAFFLAVANLDLFRDGMEVTLAIPLALGLLLLLLYEGDWSVRRCFLTSLTAAAMIMARLDSTLVVIALALLLGIRRKTLGSVTGMQVVAAAAGMLPVAVYLLINVLYFHTLMPVSGEAKEIRLSHMPSMVAIQSTVFAAIHEHRHLVPAVLSVAGLLLLQRSLRGVSAQRRATLLSFLLLPWLQILLLTWLSDWRVWSWYFYTFNIAACAGLCVFCVAMGNRSRTLAISFSAAVLLIACMESAQILVHRLGGDPVNVENGMRLAEFAKSHPGNYAMGDLAAFAGTMIPYPMVQTEGLVMDPAFLEKIRRQENLIAVLRGYGVRYYVSSVDQHALDTPCYHAEEPRREGASSARMQADLCIAPVLSYDVGIWHTRVYDLQMLPDRN